jgi:hypothetical protein
VYIAGKMRGEPEFGFPLFFECEEWLREKGGWEDIFNPAGRDSEGGFDTRGLDGHEDLADLGFDLSSAMRDDLDFIVNRAVAVCLLPGWSRSVGAQHEKATAELLGLDVFYYIPGLGWPLSNDPAPGDLHEPDDETQVVDVYDVVPLEDACEIAPEEIRSGRPSYVLDRAASLVYGDRNGSYGSPLDDYARTVTIFNAVTGRDLSPLEGLVFMKAVKMSRLGHGLTSGFAFDSVADTLTDDAGYTECLARAWVETDARS